MCRYDHDLKTSHNARVPFAFSKVFFMVVRKVFDFFHMETLAYVGSVVIINNLNLKEFKILGEKV